MTITLLCMDGVNKSGDSALRASSFFFLRRLRPVAISGVAGCEQNFLLLFCDLDRDLKAEAVVKTASAVVSIGKSRVLFLHYLLLLGLGNF